ncbi:hypothetical protein JCGZ_03835 [Jatropha curcas]|uniref:Aminotransferase-like plant mobile domain-containing protein n=1 Tax=Jatropha curcas TaxID=180498 RepID=A0A067JMB4_JATCU|nr:hypothetical protein JCGZ_03835 [Jatropha curcas]
MYDDMCDMSRGHCKLSGTYYFWEYFPYTRPELIRADLELGLVPLAWRWYRSNLHTVRCKKSLRDLRAFFDTCPLEQVKVGPMTARLQSWIQAAAHTEGIPHVELIMGGDYDEFCRISLMQPIGSRLDDFQRAVPSRPLCTPKF